MKKTELVEAIEKKDRIYQEDADAAVKAALESIEEALRAGDKVQLIGFGTFEVKERAAREGRNPQTGEKMIVAASRSVHFKPSSNLKNVTYNNSYNN